MNYGIMHQILHLMTASWPKIEIFIIQDGSGFHVENRFFGHNSSTDMSDFSEIVYEQAEQHVGKGYGTKTANFNNPRWRTAAILKMIKLPYLSEKLFDFDETWYITSDIEPDDSHVMKNWNF